MPTFPNIQAFEREVGNLSRTLNRQLWSATKEMAENAERVSIREASSDLGGNTTFDGSGGRGGGWPGRDLADLRVKRGYKNPSYWLFPTRKSGGPWKVANQGRNQGDVRGRGGSEIFIGPSINRKSGETFRTKSGNVRRTRYRRTARWSGYTAGFGTADRAADKFGKDAEKIGDKRFRQALSKHFDVT